MKRITPEIEDDPIPPPTNPAAVAAWEQRVLGRNLHTALYITRAVVLEELEKMPPNQPPRWIAQRSYTLGRLRLAIEHMTQVMKTLGIKEVDDDTVDAEKEEPAHT